MLTLRPPENGAAAPYAPPPGGTKVPGMIFSKQPSKWTSKDRFAAKRLRVVADKLDSDKRAIIEQKSAFRSLMNVSPFNIPNELIDYVAQHTSPVLREFKVGKKRIVFTKDMVTKVFGIVSGCKPVVSLKRSEQSSLRDVYRGSNPRPDIPTTIKILTECDVTDEDTIVRSWDLLCMATVVDPRSSNHVSMDYLSSMSDPSKTHEYAWDEYILDLAMKEVNKMHKKRVKPLVVKGEASKFEYWISGPFAILGIVYMDHLEFPPNNYFLDFAKTPYSVAASEPVDVPEANPSASLNEWIVFPSSQELEVPDRYKHLHEKHKAIFASDVDVATKNLAIVNGDNTADADLNIVAPMAEGGEPVTPIVPKSPAAMIIVSGSKDATTGPDTLAKKNRYKRAAKVDRTPQKLKKIKVSQDTAGIYDKFVLHGQKFKRQPKNHMPKEFVRIGRYFCSYKSFHDSLKPRQYLSSEVMNVWNEKSNREAKIVSQKNPRLKKKYAFTQHLVDKLIVDPAAFDLDACMKELRNINSKFNVLKDVLLYFPIVKDGHWITCCINICFEEFHIFHSMKTAKDSSLLEQYALNLFANFNRLVKESGLSKINFDEYLLTSTDHPQQTTLFDCGFFTQIFMENFDGKLMAHFDNNAIPDHRKLVAASLIENRDNGDDTVEAVMEEDLVKTKKK
ncbi:hypothetical protein ACQ4PT_069595 [Festuca glaucescens]